MKKLFNIILTIVLLIPYFIMPDVVKGKTLGDLEKELAEIEKNLEKQEQEEQLTEEEITRTKKNIEIINKNIEQIRIDIKNLEIEIENLSKDIIEKEEEIKLIINFLQISSGESVYLEYAFGAKDFTDFIYRAAVAEQLANYNKELITSYDNMIKQNETKTRELDNKNISLVSERKNLQANVTKLSSKLEEISEIKVTLKEDIKVRQSAIQVYKENGCKSNEDIKTCGDKTLPKDTTFLRPIVSGWISSGYGWRDLDGNPNTGIDGREDDHTGIDLAQGGWAVPIYASAAGQVVYTGRWGCGGNIIFINHNVNGNGYVTVYMHLRTILVQRGQIVTQNTQIATMGGSPATEYWDTCSFGQHVHFMVSEGYYDPYDGWGSVYSGRINPANVVNFPGDGTYRSYNMTFSGRYTKY